ncbi:unnamed protein product [Boreogadus saida]
MDLAQTILHQHGVTSAVLALLILLVKPARCILMAAHRKSTLEERLPLGPSRTVTRRLMKGSTQMMAPIWMLATLAGPRAVRWTLVVMLSQYPVPEGYPEELVAPMDQELEEPEEEPVLSDVSDLEPVYHFSSRSRDQQGRQAFFLTRYNPGEPMVASADTLVSNSYGMGNGEGGPADPRQPGKGDY